MFSFTTYTLKPKPFMYKLRLYFWNYIHRTLEKLWHWSYYSHLIHLENTYEIIAMKDRKYHIVYTYYDPHSKLETPMQTKG